MKLRNALAVLAGVALLYAAQATADTINITVDSGGNLLNDSGVASKTQYEGLNGGNVDNDPTSNLSFLNTLINNWNGVHTSTLPHPATSTGWAETTVFSGDPEGTFGFTGVSGTFDYVVLHYGAGQAGENGWWQSFYLGGADVSTLTFPLPTVDEEDIGGISSARFFGPSTKIPDGGMTLILLGAALSGLAVMRRFVKA